MVETINEIYDTKIVLNGKPNPYYFLFQLCLPKVCPVPFSINLISMPKLRRFLMIGQRSNLCQLRSPRTAFNLKTGWLPYQMKLSHKSTGRFPTITQPH